MNFIFYNMANLPSFFILHSKLFNDIREAVKNNPNDADLGRLVRSIVINNSTSLKQETPVRIADEDQD